MERLENKIKEWKEYQALINEITALKDSIADEIKEYLAEINQQTATIGEYKVSYTDCMRKDIDKKALQAEHSDLYAAYLKETTYKRFCIA